MTSFIADFRSAVRGDLPEEGRPSGRNLLGTLARYPALAKAFLTFNGHLLAASALSAKVLELLILRVAVVRRCDYEWAQHVIRAQEAGFSDVEISRIAEGPDAAGWTLLERSLLRSVDELLADGVVSGDTWGVLAGEFNDQQLMDVVFTVGTYELLAMALRSFEVEPEADLLPYLPGGR